MNLGMGASVRGKTMMFSQRTEQTLPNSRNITPVIVITSVTKYTNHVAEDSFSKATLPLLCDKLVLTTTGYSVARDVCVWDARKRLGGKVLLCGPDLTQFLLQI